MLTSLLLAAAGLSHVAPSCSWDHPGADRFRGNVAAAVDHYPDIPPAIRAALKSKIGKGEQDDMVRIGRDSIEGRDSYGPGISDMHFGAASMCRTVTRAKWRSGHQEPAAVYCVQDVCVMVPIICSNLSRIKRRPRTKAADATAPLDAAGKQAAALAMPDLLAPSDADAFDPATAGLIPGLPPADAGDGGDGGPVFPDAEVITVCRLSPHDDCLPAAPGPALAVPEPPPWMLLLAGGALLAWRRRSVQAR